MSVSYDRKQINLWLDSRTRAKARDYVDAVSEVRWVSGHILAGRVQGTRSQPYDVRVDFSEVDASDWIDGECSCPVGFNCKHVAALLIAALPLRQKLPASGVRPEVLKWVEGFRVKHAQAAAGTARKSPRSTQALAYVISKSLMGYPEVSLYKARTSVDGSIQKLDDPWYNVEKALVQPPKFVTADDLPVLRGLWFGPSRSYHSNSFRLDGAAGTETMEKVIATGRAFVSLTTSIVQAGEIHALRPGSSRPGQIEWRTQADTSVRPVLQTEPPATMLMTTTQPCWYLDAQTGEAGAVDVPWPADQLSEYLSMPPVTPEEAVLVGKVLREVAPDLPLPPAHDRAALRVIDATPVPVLSLETRSAYATASSNAVDFATVKFDYAGESVDAYSDTTLVRDSKGDAVQITRQHDVEERRLKELGKVGLKKFSTRYVYGPRPLPERMLAPENADDWLAFVKRVLPTLREKGWQVTMSDTFRFNVIEIEAIEGDLREAGDGWFDVEMGVSVNGRTVRLEPLLTDLFRRDRRWLLGKLDEIDDDAYVQLVTDRNERLHLPAERLKPVVRVLIDLFDFVGEGKVRISKWDAARFDALDKSGRWQFHGDDSVRQLAQRLVAGPGVAETPVPRGLRAELRAYQRQGLSWMQFLREQNLSGVLADDMGLGKTVQTLAHILAEKEAGRLDRPALIVVPTTLMHNWTEEARRFAPDLRVLDLHGPQRHERFDEIGRYDLILTTYALLWRDQAVLAQHSYHLLILDEAQYVKNAATKAAATIRELQATHRLCLTGTPLENHLGELWAQFDFLLPGFLGTRQDFTRRWRTPIEKGGDTTRRELLARRIRPFMLRRRKDEVATELPPKTTIVRTIELEGAQRDLYETVRSAMQEKVRAAVAAKGLARSHIVVLEALLKLRQVCCDPRLVKNAQSARIRESAKLELLLEMLPELIEEGRRILLFSQFTGMLDLIATALGEAQIPYVTLTGETTDRVTPVKRFMQGKVPLFLISLKAGGVGLNLTAADTVIHYDPWWNPAVENQATDRAHRLGQDRPVFVYKLITAGSVEEKIVAMQARKAALADAILSDNAAGAVKFSEEDLAALFEPIPAVSANEPASKKRPRTKAVAREK
ncbi:DEAD/DEAH box helicase [Paraburkholderia hospita]|uniref:DEAD/DEAH box helicase n=1 Tax=Paraburkholderia hospita TaxID=169430 RepID=UPI0002719DB3|nr:DEAD/DEAH box helicase [Paraburkholderia hospita]SKC94695.1 SWIM zinc finger [Paraburkholderia hospita]